MLYVGRVLLAVGFLPQIFAYWFMGRSTHDFGRRDVVLLTGTLIFVFGDLALPVHHFHPFSGLLLPVADVAITLPYSAASLSRAATSRSYLAIGLAQTVAIFVTTFADAYYRLSTSGYATFSATPPHKLTRLDSVYFSLTTTTTVGYGDIVPRDACAHGVVVAQLALGLILLVGVVNIGLARFAAATPKALPPGDGPGAMA